MRIPSGLWRQRPGSEATCQLELEGQDPGPNSISTTALTQAFGGDMIFMEGPPKSPEPRHLPSINCGA